MRPSVFAAMAASAALAACATPSEHSVRLHPQSSERLGTAHRIGVVQPKVVSGLLDRLGVDVLAIPYGRDEISSGGRKATQAVGAVAAMLLGVGAVGRSGVTLLNLAIVDRSGAVVWFNLRGAAGAYDLRKPDSAQEMVGRLLQDLPGAHK